MNGFSRQSPFSGPAQLHDIRVRRGLHRREKHRGIHRKKLQLLTAASDTVGTSFKSVFENMAKPAVVKPPMKSPIEGLKYAQVGSSVGQKLNPFYKVLAHHDGVDLIAGQGTPVLATADGVVTDVRKSGKGLGNVVEITHEGGYVTTFAHLEDIVVRKGEKVKAGKNSQAWACLETHLPLTSTMK